MSIGVRPAVTPDDESRQADSPVAETMAGDVVLRLRDITIRFGSLVANDSIGFELKRGEVVALLGENGAGKTTLMNILFGHYVADEGVVEVGGLPLPAGDPAAALAAGVGMVHQHFTLTDNLSVLDNIALGTQSLWSYAFRRNAARERIKKLSSDFGLAVDPERMVRDLSVGERQRVEILKALYRKARILILDEPTAVLTPLETEALFKTLKMLTGSSPTACPTSSGVSSTAGRGLSILFISHKLQEVMTVSDRVLVLRGGKLVGKRVTAKTNRRELAELMVGGEIPEPTVETVEPGPTVLALKNVSTAQRGTGASLVGASLELRAGEITGLAGVSGNGQAVLAGLMSGTEKLTAGSMEFHGQPIRGGSPREAIERGIGRIPEDRHAIGSIGNMSVMENMISERYRSSRFMKYGFLDWGAARTFTEDAITAYDIKCPSYQTRIRLLSGGNMQKLILARALDGGPDLIVANQPTRGLDVGAVAYVHGQLLAARKRGAAILLISEDLDEVLNLADQVIVMHGGRLSSPSKRGARSVYDIGELMAGHTLGHGEQPHHAA